MSSLTPSRIRTKTSDIAELFRASQTGSHSRSPPNDLSTQSRVTTYSLDVPSTGTGHDGLARKMTTRIPFLGRQRKKSTPKSYASDSTRESTDVGEQLSRTASTDRRPTIEIATETTQTSRTSVVASSPQKPQSASLGSKLAAHFTPRTRKLSALGSKPPAESPPKATNLSPPDVSTTRGASFDSASSGTRSTTPRPMQPTITVSFTSENLDEYKDLFTMPKRKKLAPVPIDAARAIVENKNHDSDATPSSTPSTSPRVPSKLEEIHRRGSTATILDISRQKTSRNQHPDSPIPKPSKPTRRSSPTEKQDSTASSTPRNSDGKDSTHSSISDKLSGPPIQRRPSAIPTTPAADYSAQQRLRMRQQVAAGEKRNRPPAIPLPETPSSPPVTQSSRPSSQASIAPTGPLDSNPSRPRAGTVGSVASISSSPLAQSTLPQDFQVEDDELQPQTEAILLDLDSATPDQLKEALITRNRQHDELTSLLLKTTENHLAEKAVLEKKISQLEREMSKKENQIKGLMWLVANNKAPPATDFPENLDLPALPTSQEAGKDTQKVAVTRLLYRRTQLSDDSGAESHPTSGAESLRSSETSGNESSSLRHRKSRRPFLLGDGSFRRYPPQTLAPEGALPELPTKRSSVSSFSLSSASSTSSLLPPSPSVTLSSLSSIPEAPSSLRYSSKPDSHEVHYEERRSIRASNRMSISSSSTAASSSYAANLKRSRPPSIAQVLENGTPNMGDVLDKLRPVGQ